MRFVVYAPRYRSDSGGAIVLHKLCDVLNGLGHQASLWPLWKPRPSTFLALRHWPKALAYFGSRIYRGRFTTHSGYHTPLAYPWELDDCVIVYPEIVRGNPLNAKRYVRWLLHEPGFHEGGFRHAEGDLYFCYQDAFNKHCDDMIYGGNLTIADTFLDIYTQTNTAPRSKICYMVRKGSGRGDVPDLSNQWVVDGYDHYALAKAFNECRVCYFYDLHTSYASYAAACGCIPVIVPVDGLSKEAWVPEEAGRYGVAYGEDDIPHALETRELMLRNMRNVARSNVASATHFVSVVRDHFQGPL